MLKKSEDDSQMENVEERQQNKKHKLRKTKVLAFKLSQDKTNFQKPQDKAQAVHLNSSHEINANLSMRAKSGQAYLPGEVKLCLREQTFIKISQTFQI